MNKKTSHTQTFIATTSREMSSNPLPKQSTSHRHPVISSYKVKSHAGIMAMNTLTLLLENQSQPTLT
jgi:hypothetical protein